MNHKKEYHQLIPWPFRIYPLVLYGFLLCYAFYAVINYWLDAWILNDLQNIRLEQIPGEKTRVKIPDYPTLLETLSKAALGDSTMQWQGLQKELQALCQKVQEWEKFPGDLKDFDVQNPGYALNLGEDWQNTDDFARVCAQCNTLIQQCDEQLQKDKEPFSQSEEKPKLEKIRNTLSTLAENADMGKTELPKIFDFYQQYQKDLSGLVQNDRKFYQKLEQKQSGRATKILAILATMQIPNLENGSRMKTLPSMETNLVKVQEQLTELLKLLNLYIPTTISYNEIATLLFATSKRTGQHEIAIAFLWDLIYCRGEDIPIELQPPTRQKGLMTSLWDAIVSNPGASQTTAEKAWDYFIGYVHPCQSDFYFGCFPEKIAFTTCKEAISFPNKVPWYYPNRQLGPLNTVESYQNLSQYCQIEREKIDGRIVEPLADPIFLMVKYIQEMLRKQNSYSRAVNFNGFIQFWSFWFFGVAILILCTRLRYYTAVHLFGMFPIGKELRGLNNAKQFEMHLNDWENADLDVPSNLAKCFKDAQSFIVENAFQPLTIRQASHYTSLESRREEEKKGFEIIDIYREYMESGYASIRYLAWSIPSIGFLGTVLGIGWAMIKADKIVTESGVGQAEILKSITIDLGVAFDTTLIALLLCIVLMLLIYWIQSAEDMLFSQTKEQISRIGG